MEFKSFMEALKGKQHKIDKNKNGKVDSHDLELLRKEETEELDEIHRMKTKLNKLDPISNRSVARQKLSNLMKSGKARGALIANKMRTLNMGDDLDQEDLDALHEVLSKDAKAGDFISDFVHSTNPKFDGKSKKERINMALGAYYDTYKKKDGVSEGYQSHSGRSHGNPYGGGGFGRREREDDEYHVPDPTPVAPVPAKKYIKGTPENQALKASRKPINGMPTEEVVNESHDVDQHFHDWTNSENAPDKSDAGDDNKIYASAMRHLHGSKVPKEDHDELAGKLADKYHGIDEEVEGLDELHPLTYMSYHNKATAIGRDGTKAFDKSGKDRSANIEKADKRVTDSAHGKGPLAKLYPTGKKSTLGKKAQAAVRSNAQWGEEAEELEEGDLSVRHLYNKFADAHVGGNDTKPTEKAIKKVHGDEVFAHMKKAANANAKGDMDGEERHFDNAQNAARKTDRIGSTVGRDRSAHRKQFEEVEQIDEKSEQAKQNKTMKNMMDASRGARYKLNNPVPAAEPEHTTAQAHNKAIGRALRSDLGEDKMTTTKDKSGKLISFKYEGDWKKSTGKKQGSGVAANLAGQALKKMKEPNEEYISQEEYNNLSLDEQALYERTEKSLGKRAADMHNAASHIVYGANAGSPRKEMSSAKKDFRKIGKSIAKTHGKDVAKQAGDAAHDNAFMGNASAGASDGSHKKFYSSLPDKEKKAYTTRNQKHGLEEAKDEQEYGYEGDMALNQLATLTRCAEMIKEILKPDTDMPEWVQSKITLATDYIQTAADYMHSEMNEAKSVTVKVNHAGDAPHEEKWEPVKKIKKPVEEAVQKVDIPAYLRKAKGDTPLKMDDLKRKDTISDPENLKKNRLADSFDNEGNLISNKVSYKDFMLEYTPGPGGVTQIKGRSYGANYSDPEGADDADDNKPMKPAAEKRGRGRPAGAKSGARKITGTSKLMNK